jgi:hypothetical protein
MKMHFFQITITLNSGTVYTGVRFYPVSNINFATSYFTRKTYRIILPECVASIHVERIKKEKEGLRLNKLGILYRERMGF